MDFFFFIAVSLFSYFFCFWSLPILNKLGQKYGLIDGFESRKENKAPLVRIGGLSIFLAFILGFLSFNFLRPDIIGHNFFINFSLGSSLFFILGFLDDIFNLSPILRLFFQVIFASIMWSLGTNIQIVDIHFLNLNVDHFILNNSLSLVITVIWIVGLINAINWMDGLDGLLAGCAVIYCIGFCLISFKSGNLNTFYTSAFLALSLLAFLSQNFYPAKIIMGDGGSNFVGYCLSLIALKSNYSSNFFESVIDLNSNNHIINPIYPLLILFIPVFDMIKVIFLRLVEKRSPFFPDRRHIHHQILNLGFIHPHSVLIEYSLSLLLVFIAVSIKFLE